MIDMKKAAKLIGIPIKNWPGNCSLIAQGFLDKGIVEGKHQYGHYLGHISPDSECFGGRVFTHHAWILSPNNEIIDPTRWVFENVEPYLYVGPNNPKEYDFGGNLIHEIYNGRPAPKYDPDVPQFDLPKDKSIWLLLASLLEYKKFTVNKKVSQHQVFWLANLAPRHFDGHEESVYKYIADELNLSGFIPFDNRMNVLGK